MTVLEVGTHDNRQLQNIANALAAAKKVVVVTGAGISTNCGIPVSHAMNHAAQRSELTMVRIFGHKRASML